ncbi:MAG TPA: BatD family protein [Thermoanaerobaculia bacterium]|nr:BatD family protein [Thermoanaerobaculia bacterium]
MRRALLALLLFTATSVYANDLTVDRHTIRIDESVTIIVSLEGAFANIDSLKVPLRNLEMDGPPSVSTEFAWINGTTSRRKTLRYSAHPLASGGALVGPIVIDGDGGQRDTLAPVSIQVIPDEAAQSNDPLTILHALLTTGREPFFVVADVDKTSCYAGEEVIVTWYLYNGATVQRWDIANVPKLADFWTEEIDVRNEPPQQVVVGTSLLEKVPVRRIALFPLRSGTLQLGSTTIDAEILRRLDDSPFGIFEGSVVDARTTSAPVSIDVKPLPPDAANDIVGDVDLDCGAATQSNGGPVTLTVGLSGRANLRAAPAPHFDGKVDGDVEVQPLAVEVNKTREGATMSRKWRFVVFPAHAGTLTLPPIAAEAFNPANAQRVHLRCQGTTLAVRQANRQPLAVGRQASVAKRDWRPWAEAIALLVILAMLVIPPLRRASSTRGDVRQIVNGGLHDYLVRKKIDETALANEISDRGDAYRALVSLQRIDAENAGLEQRARDLVESLR